GLAVPVFDSLGKAIAALSIVGPNDDRLTAHVPLLLAAARGIRRALNPSANT
ncbi:MAG: IclR family transcriptional regulator, partial [Mycolicibacterium sp.]